MTVKKQRLFEFESGIYPRCLWVGIGLSYDFLSKYFEVLPNINIESGKHLIGPAAYNNIFIKNKKCGQLVLFRNKVDMNSKIILHESAHATLDLFFEITRGIEEGIHEPFAYYQQWIFECAVKARDGKVKPIIEEDL